MSSKQSKWSDSFYTGILWQDFQHKTLLQKLLVLQGAIIQNLGGAVVAETLDFLDHYVQEHFGLEEAYMKALHYPGYELHKKEHGSFIAQLQEMKKIKVPSVAAENLSLELQKWIIEHITRLDKGLGQFMKTAGMR